MSEPFKVLRAILQTGDTHADFFAMCDLLESSSLATIDPNTDQIVSRITPSVIRQSDSEE